MFKDAKFGDMFKTRSGLQALYLYKGRDCNNEKDVHKLIIIGDDWSNDYNEDGSLWSSEHRELDIVSHW